MIVVSMVQSASRMCVPDRSAHNTNPVHTTQTQTHTGYILAVIFLDRIGRKNLQMIGFAGEALVFMLMAIFHQQFKGLPALFVIM